MPALGFWPSTFLCNFLRIVLLGRQFLPLSVWGDLAAVFSIDADRHSRTVACNRLIRRFCAALAESMDHIQKTAASILGGIRYRLPQSETVAQEAAA